MKRFAFWAALLAAIFGAGKFVLAASPGSVAGGIQVHKAKIKTSGAKHARDVVVYLKPLAPQLRPPPDAHAVMDQRGLVFIPHVMAVQKGTTVDFLNSDNDRHNVYFLNDVTGDTLDIGTWGPGESVSHTFQEAGLIITLCQLHLEMAAYILVLEYPFYAVVALDADTLGARFEIQGVPPGDYELHVWHKKLKMKGRQRAVAVAAGNVSQVDIEITRGKYAN